MTRHALISGAGIAGPALAAQLAARGWRTTVLERAPGLREEGHDVDVRGAAREVLRRMGLEDAVRAAGTHEAGLRVVDDLGRTVSSFPVDTAAGTDGPTAQLAVLRGELARVLHEHADPSTEHRFGRSITAVDDGPDAVRATLDDGVLVEADVLVVAEGLRSRTRDLVMPGPNVRELGMYVAYLTLPREDGDNRWWNWHHVPGSRGVHLRPDDLGTTRAMLSFLSAVRGLEDLRREDQVAILRRTFADVGGAAPRVLRELGDAPLYVDALGQARPRTWSAGRTVLLGDTAFCPSPVGCGGSSLALVGAHVLAGELDTAPDHREAFRRYEAFLRPHVEAAQGRARPVGLANPRTAGGVRALRAATRVMSSPKVQKVAGVVGRRTGGVSAEDVVLPVYAAAPA